MEHQALYRKYRPRSFEDVCGQEHITSVLRYESEAGRLSHAYLFCGPRGTGKTTCAKILAKAVNCDSPVNGDPCGKCFKCMSIDDGSATDVVEMDAASNTGVEYIRDIRDEVAYSPAVMKKRVYIIDEVHMLSIGAFNALLKTLEEPPEHVLFILATTEQHKLPATIISRCQRFDFRRITVSDIASRLEYIAGKEGISLEHDAAVLLAKQAQGGMRDAINLFELCAGGTRTVTELKVRETLGISGIESSHKTALAVKGCDIGTLFDAVSEVISSSKDVTVFWQELISFWRDMLVAKSVKDPAAYLDLTAPEAELLRDAAGRFTTAELIYQSGLLDEALTSMNKMPQVKRNLAELTLVKMSTPSLTASTDALVARLSVLEDKVKLLESGAVRARHAEPVAAPIAEQQDVSKEPIENCESKKAAPSTPDVGLMALPDKSELLEKIGQMNPPLKGFMAGVDCLISPDGAKILIRASNAFAISMMDNDDSRRTLSDAFTLCGLAQPDAELKFELAETVGKKPSMLDELDGF